MAKSAIEWTDSVWNPTTGCTKISAGCDHCYAEVMSLRLQRMGQPKYADGFAVRTHEAALYQPLSWTKPRRIFVNSMSDVFHAQVPRAFVDRIFAVMALAPRHTYQLLTKRPERMARYLNDPATPKRIAAAILETVPWAYWHGVRTWEALPWPLPGVWLGTSIEDAPVLQRMGHLGACPAVIRFLSCEPLIGGLGPTFRDRLADSNVGWVIAGGESGPDHRPVAAEWVVAIRDACQDAGVPFFFKQWGGKTPKSGGRLLDGREWSEFPVVGAAVVR